MSFFDDIKVSIQLVADTYGTTEVKENLGSRGKIWNPDPVDNSKNQSLVLFLQGLANAIEARTISRFTPFNGALNKTILGFLSPNVIILDNTNGILENDTFGVNGSRYNDGGKTITSISGNNIIVKQRVNTEMGASVPITIGPPDEDLNVEQTINRVQASIGDAMPKAATRNTLGLIKQAACISPTGIVGDRAAEKLDEVIRALKYTNIPGITGDIPTNIMALS